MFIICISELANPGLVPFYLKKSLDLVSFVNADKFQWNLNQVQDLAKEINLKMCYSHFV